MTSKLFEFYYFTVISFITFIPYALLSIRLPVMYIIPVVGVLVFLISILRFYISYSVKMMQSSKELIRLNKLRQQNHKSKGVRMWQSRFWKSCHPISIWVGSNFTL